MRFLLFSAYIIVPNAGYLGARVRPFSGLVTPYPNSIADFFLFIVFVKVYQ